MRGCNGVIFDMDGLMFDTEKTYSDAFISAMTEMGYERKKVASVCASMIGRNRASCQKIICLEYGKEFDFDTLRQKRTFIIQKARKELGLILKPGLQELIEWIRLNDLPYAIASSSDRAVIERNLQDAHLTHLFPHFIGGNEVTHGKPDPEIFRKAAALLQLPPSQCVVLEDANTGIRAAYDAGAIPFMVPDLQEPSDESRQLAHAIFPSLFEAKEYLERMMSHD